ncbi:MAG: EF-hand domain-containing protein [Aquabacterium sp.]
MSSISSIGGTASWNQTSNVRSGRPHHAEGGDPAEMFKKIDTDGSGGVDATELQTMFTNMASKMGGSGSTGSTPDASQMIKEFDADGDGTLNQEELGKGMQSLMPPPNTMDFARQRASSTDSSSSTDGSSMQQTMQDLLGAIDTNQDGTIDKSEMATFKQIATEEANSLTQTSSSSSTSSDSSSSSSSSSESASRQSSMEELARMVIQRYASMGADATQSSLTSSLSVAA